MKMNLTEMNKHLASRSASAVSMPHSKNDLKLMGHEVKTKKSNKKKYK